MHCLQRSVRSSQKNNSRQLKQLEKNVKNLWDGVNKVVKKKPGNPPIPEGVTAETLNQHYASISTDEAYVKPTRRVSVYQQESYISDLEMFHILDHLKHTATGLDGVPAWFLRL